MKCKLCDNKAEEDSLLCKRCTMARLSAASASRIMSGRGLNLENMRAFSEENFIKMITDD